MKRKHDLQAKPGVVWIESKALYPFALTERDRAVISVLACRASIIDVPQAARTWWTDTVSGRECARQRLGRLVRAGRLTALKVRVHSERVPNSPLWSWRPGDPTPPFGVISYIARARWDAPLRWVTVFTASEKSGRLFASRGGGLSHPLQATHDLHMTAIYLRLLKEKPAEAAGWVSDNVLAPLRRGKKLPDAEIQDAHGRTLKVIEFVGSYPPERILRVHEDCQRRNVPYELW